MKIVADVSERGKIPEYLTAGKEYPVIRSNFSGIGVAIMDDEGDEIYCYLKASTHLNGGSWRVVEE